MVKLIRLKGQAKSGSTGVEINNNFSSSIFVQPKSRLALRSVQVELEKARGFAVPVNTIYRYRINGGLNDDLTTVAVPAVSDQGSLNPILTEMQIAANSTAPVVSAASKYSGSLHIYDMNAEKARLRSYQADPKNAGYDNWLVDSGSFTTLTADALTSDGSQEVETYLTEVVPLVNNTVNFTYAVTGDITWAHVEYDAPSQKIYGVQIDSTLTPVSLIANNSIAATSPYAITAGDVVQMTKSGRTITLTVTDNLGSLQVSLTAELNDTYVRPQALYNLISIPQGQTTGITSGGNALQALDIDPTDPASDGRAHSFRVNFPNLNGTNVQTLARTLGFDSATNYDNTGAPATIEAPRVSTGTELNGVLVAIDGLDLDTYVGATNGIQNDVNILDVLQLPSNSADQSIDYQSNFPVPLDLKNDREQIIRNLRLRFLDNDLNVLAYKGEPIVVLELYGPDEST